MIISRLVLLRLRNISHISCRENQNTHFAFTKVFQKSCRSSDNVGKYGRDRQSTKDIITQRMRFAAWKTKCYTHTPSTCNTYCLPMAKMVTRTRLNITFIRNIGCERLRQNSGLYLVKNIPGECAASAFLFSLSLSLSWRRMRKHIVLRQLGSAVNLSASLAPQVCL